MVQVCPVDQLHLLVQQDQHIRAMLHGGTHGDIPMGEVAYATGSLTPLGES
jgi:hypothetical protein